MEERNASKNANKGEEGGLREEGEGKEEGEGGGREVRRMDEGALLAIADNYREVIRMVTTLLIALLLTPSFASSECSDSL